MFEPRYLIGSVSPIQVSVRLGVCTGTYESGATRTNTPGSGPVGADFGPFDHGPLQKIQDPMQLRRRPRIPESSFRPVVRGQTL